MDPLYAIEVNRNRDHGPKDKNLLEREVSILELLLKKHIVDYNKEQMLYERLIHMIEEVTETTLHLAAIIHSVSWKESHRSFCSEEFVSAHTPERQKEYLQKIINSGATVYMLTIKGEPVGIVSVNKALIENLYILPAEQNKGYGTTLLKHAIGKCEGKPVLWVLSNNSARGFYEKYGFTATGNTKRLSDNLSEIEMCIKI